MATILVRVPVEPALLGISVEVQLGPPLGVPFFHLAGSGARRNVAGVSSSSATVSGPSRQAKLTNMSLLAHDRLPAQPIDALRELVRTIDECDELKRDTVAAAREAGATWESIGKALGITRQSAWALYSADAAAISADLAASAANNPDLSEDEALDIAVEEVRAVRRSRRAR